MFAATLSRPTLLARLTALAAVVLVLALTVLSASPELHAQLHAHDGAPASHAASGPDADADGGCVITLFAQGVIALLAFFVLVFLGERVQARRLVQRDRVPPIGPDFRFLPTQAPPAA